MRIMRILIYSFLTLVFLSCSYYSFSGQSIPPHIKNAQLLIFDDNSGRYDLSLPDRINEKVTSEIEDYNYFEIENSEDADAKIFGSITSFRDEISSQTRQEEIDQMTIILTAEINFYDNIKEKFIVKNLRVSSTEHYEASDGDTAREEAFENALDRLSEDIVIGLSSNW